MRRAPLRRSRRAVRGFALLEVLMGLAVLVIALLSQASSTLSGHRLAEVETHHGIAVEMLRAFTERLRGDASYDTLYERLRLRDAAFPQGSPPTAYYTGFPVPRELGDVRIRAQVPVAASSVVTTPDEGGGEVVFGMGGGSTGGTTETEVEGPALREDLDLPAFDLPFDLDGDGTIDGASRGEDYITLPVLLEVFWTSPGEPEQKIRSLVWLKGER